MSSLGSLRVIAGVFLLTALFIGGVALALEPPQVAQLKGLIPDPAIPIIQDLVSGKPYMPIPLTYITSDDPTQKNSFNTYVRYDFVYRGTTNYIFVPYNTAAYESTKKNYPQRAEDRQRAGGQLLTLLPNAWWLVLPTEDYWTWWFSQINDPAQTEMYDSIISQLEVIRQQYQLDDNEYAELIARFVQRAVPNGEEPAVERYPIETIADKQGGRKDKGMLLAGLLCHAGYGAAIIDFQMVNQFVVGIPGDHKAPEYDGYIAVDPATETFFGFDDARSTSVRVLDSFWGQHNTGPVCDGKGYTAGTEVRLIQDTWIMDKYFQDNQAFAKDLSFIEKNRDNRHLVFQYLTETGLFRYS